MHVMHNCYFRVMCDTRTRPNLDGVYPDVRYTATPAY
jgi:hypothetical protein